MMMMMCLAHFLRGPNILSYKLVNNWFLFNHSLCHDTSIEGVDLITLLLITKKKLDRYSIYFGPACMNVQFGIAFIFAILEGAQLPKLKKIHTNGWL